MEPTSSGHIANGPSKYDYVVSHSQRKPHLDVVFQMQEPSRPSLLSRFLTVQIIGSIQISSPREKAGEVEGCDWAFIGKVSHESQGVWGDRVVGVYNTRLRKGYVRSINQEDIDKIFEIMAIPLLLEEAEE
jgi:hypothetical protein